MRLSILGSTLIATLLLSGCSTSPDIPGIPKEPNPLAQFVVQKTVDAALDLTLGQKSRERCIKNKTNKRTTRAVASDLCRAEDRAQATRKKRAEAKEDMEAAKALQSSFDQRNSNIDTADIIEQQRRKTDWIAESEKNQRSVVFKDKPDEFD